MSKLEVLELEYTDDDILYYIDDEQGNEIGFAVREDGKEVEYYYADDAKADESLAHKVGHAVGKAANTAKSAIEGNSLISREQVSDLKNDLNVIYKENAETMKTLRSVAQDMRDFKDFFSGKPIKPRPENTPAQTAASETAQATPKPAQEETSAIDHAEHKKKKKKKKKSKVEKKAHENADANEAASSGANSLPAASEPAPSVSPASPALLSDELSSSTGLPPVGETPSVSSEPPKFADEKAVARSAFEETSAVDQPLAAN